MTLEGFWFEYGGWLLTYVALLVCAIVLVVRGERKRP